MKLDDLLARTGAILDLGWTRRTVEWHDGTEAVSFSVNCKNAMTASDQEFIYLAVGDRRDTKDKGEASIMARRLHRMIRIGDDNETIPVSVAERMNPELIAAILKQLDVVEVPPETPDEAAKN